MGDGVTTPISIEDFVAVVSKNYIRPHLVSIPTGTTYTKVQYDRPVFFIPKTPTTVGIVYIFPGAYPADDLSSIPIPAGNLVYLDARGQWYLRTSSAGTETFLVIDAGAAANAQAIASLLGGGAGAPATANRASFYSAQKSTVTAGTPVNCSAQAIPNGFALVVKAKPTNTGNIGVGTSSANANLTTGAPLILEPGASTRYYITNANLLWLDSDVNAEGVCLSAEI